jgi:hypothetical protein
MPPIWLTRLNDVLTWLNPALSLVAAVLAVMVVAAAAARVQGPRATPSLQVAQFVQRPTAPTCAQAGLPPEWRDMLLHD